MAVTLTYSPRLQGWTSFFTFHPEWMIGLNNSFYSMYQGQLYRHRDSSVNRNTFYGAYGNSTVTNVFNDSPLDAKMFKTIGLEGTQPWEATLTTDLGSGKIETAWFVKKEGDYYANIRRNDAQTDLDMMSAQGIGDCLTVDATSPPILILTFGFNINSLVNIKDIAYKQGATLLDPPISIGPITAKTDTSITIDVSTSTPVIGDMILVVKNSIAESYGTRGYYMEVQLVNSLTTQVELFSISSEAFKSYP